MVNDLDFRSPGKVRERKHNLVKSQRSSGNKPPRRSPIVNCVSEHHHGNRGNVQTRWRAETPRAKWNSGTKRPPGPGSRDENTLVLRYLALPTAAALHGTQCDTQPTGGMFNDAAPQQSLQQHAYAWQNCMEVLPGSAWPARSTCRRDDRPNAGFIANAPLDCITLQIING